MTCASGEDTAKSDEYEAKRRNIEDVLALDEPPSIKPPEVRGMWISIVYVCVCMCVWVCYVCVCGCVMYVCVWVCYVCWGYLVACKAATRGVLSCHINLMEPTAFCLDWGTA